MAKYLELVLPITNDKGEATPYFEDYLFSIITAIGGEDAPSIPDLAVIESEDTQVIRAQLKGLKLKVFFNCLVKQGNYTANDNDYIEANNGMTVKFPANPRKNSQLIIANGDGTTITMDGNGNNIKRRTTTTQLKSVSQGTSLHFAWFIEGPYWRTV